MLRAASLPFWPTRFRSLVTGVFDFALYRFFHQLPLAVDKYDGKFALGMAGVLVFTLLAYWSLTDYWNVQWYAGEDGVSEWWSVATYLASAVLATCAGVWLVRLGCLRIGSFHVLLGVAFLVGLLEEISWGQRLFGWSTPESLAGINEQDETTIHNITNFDSVFTTIIFVASFLAFTGAVARAVLHRHGRVTSADFILPSLVMSPALFMIMFWITGEQNYTGNIARILLTHFDLKPVGSEIPEVLMGLCLCLYTYGNFRRVAALRSHISAHPHKC